MKEVHMKRRYRYSFLIGAVLIIVVLLIAETLIVKVKSTYLRKEPKFYAQVVATLKAGDSLEKIKSQGGWMQARTKEGFVGWVHSSAVKPKKFSLLAMDKSLKTQASADEVALAAKGFSKQVEESYKAKNKNLSYAWVDRMLKMKVTAAQIKAFLQKGRLGEFGGSK